MRVGIIHVSRACVLPVPDISSALLNYGVREDPVLLECDAVPLVTGFRICLLHRQVQAVLKEPWKIFTCLTEDEGCIVVRNVGNISSKNSSHYRKLGSSATLLWEPPLSCTKFCILWTSAPFCYFLLLKLTNPIQQSPSWGPNRSSACQTIPRNLWNPEVHYRIPLLGHINLVLVPTSYFMKIHFNVILPSTPISWKWSLSLRFPHQSPQCTSVAQKYHIPHPSHSTWFVHPDIIWWGVQIIKCLNTPT